MLAYYYIWYKPNSWNRAKKDFPLLGKYSSDEVSVMRQHVLWAKSAGIDGFLVSWKSTPALNSRLAKLVRVADQQHFKLGILYQGLDFNRQPISIRRIRSDLLNFAAVYAGDPAFRLFARPLVVLSGTWEYTPQQVAFITQATRPRLLVLASEHTPDGYRRLAGLVDGNAYYWSSVNPYTFPAYQERLDAMSVAVHANRGLWVAPAAPGFDATLVGGTNVVDRKNGQTLQLEMEAAAGSSPDAIGLISWNEFSENSYIEPSRQFGARYLRLLATIEHTPGVDISDFDSSSPSGWTSPAGAAAIAGGVLVLGAIAYVASIRRRNWRAKGRRH